MVQYKKLKSLRNKKVGSPFTSQITGNEWNIEEEKGTDLNVEPVNLKKGTVLAFIKVFMFLFQAVPLPVALFSLSGTNGTEDMSPNRATKAVSKNIKFAPGPYGNPNGSVFFDGDESSYVELKNTGELDARFSISVFAWVHLDNGNGTIFEYGCSVSVSHLTLGIEVRYMGRKTSKIYLLHKENILLANAWNFIGTTYDYHTGIATVWVNNNTVMVRYIGEEMELATQSDVRVGASSKQEKLFRGRISCLQFYDQALLVDQIIEVKARCNNTSKYVWTVKTSNGLF